MDKDSSGKVGVRAKVKEEWGEKDRTKVGEGMNG